MRDVSSRVSDGDRGLRFATPHSAHSSSSVRNSGDATPEDPAIRGASAVASSASKSHRAVRAWHRFILRRLLTLAGEPPLAAALWDGKEIHTSSRQPLGTLVVNSPAALWRVALNPFMQFGDAYANGQLDIRGDLVEALVAIDHSLRISKSAGFLYELVAGWMRMPRWNSLAASRDNVHHHYDIGNDFYRLWLDEQMAYTCAYFPTSSASLEEAQIAKFEHVCRKVQLQSGKRVVEAGCGWGGLALYMARKHGVTVDAYNVSQEQIEYARARATAEGLDGRVNFILDDWRNIRGRYDAFISVGMLEHVGLANYRRLGEVIDGALAPNGRGLIHSIGRNRPAPLDPWIERRIFPGTYPPSLAQMMTIFEPREFSVLDIENLRLHYAQTLRHWLARFEQSVDRVTQMFDQRFVRMWRLYLAGSVAAFECGRLQLFQVVFARRNANSIPWTRLHQYVDSDPTKLGSSPAGA